jgi:hypothetical protein
MRTIFPKAGWMLAGVLALYVLSALAGAVTGGPLDPPGAPAPTLKTLGDIAPSWHQMLSSSDGPVGGCNSTRFTCVLDNAAALDHETGLVWERDASQAISQWAAAVEACVQDTIAGRRGWRLPTVDELLSLAIPFAPEPLDLPPAGSPLLAFDGNGSQRYWTATSSTLDATFAFVVDPATGSAQTLLKAGSPDHAERVVCVRGTQTSQSP